LIDCLTDENNNPLSILKMEEIKYFIAKNGKETFEFYKKNLNIDIILMDIQMPILDGYKATELIREFEKENNLKPIYIIAVTANAMEGEREKCIKIGMNDYLSKPYKYNQLIEKLNKSDEYKN
jgi:osomolarity two-component system sensor histidine kinase NIK1